MTRDRRLARCCMCWAQRDFATAQPAAYFRVRDDSAALTDSALAAAAAMLRHHPHLWWSNDLSAVRAHRLLRPHAIDDFELDLLLLEQRLLHLGPRREADDVAVLVDFRDASRARPLALVAQVRRDDASDGEARRLVPLHVSCPLLTHDALRSFASNRSRSFRRRFPSASSSSACRSRSRSAFTARFVAFSRSRAVTYASTA